MVKDEPNAHNIFNITQPEAYRCQVHHYHNRLSRLYLSVFKHPATIPAFYVLFADVAYMGCPVNWQGAEFDILPHDDCIALMLETGLIGKAILQFPGAYASLTEHTRLYSVQTLVHPVRIIAGSATMLRHIPDNLS